jgi:hypothetical protein
LIIASIFFIFILPLGLQPQDIYYATDQAQRVTRRHYVPATHADLYSISVPTLDSPASKDKKGNKATNVKKLPIFWAENFAIA